jgi:hypothetical protein
MNNKSQKRITLTNKLSRQVVCETFDVSESDLTELKDCLSFFHNTYEVKKGSEKFTVGVNKYPVWWLLYFNEVLLKKNKIDKAENVFVFVNKFTGQFSSYKKRPVDIILQYYFDNDLICPVVCVRWFPGKKENVNFSKSFSSLPIFDRNLFSGHAMAFTLEPGLMQAKNTEDFEGLVAFSMFKFVEEFPAKIDKKIDMIKNIFEKIAKNSNIAENFLNEAFEKFSVTSHQRLEFARRIYEQLADNPNIAEKFLSKI